MLYGGSSRRGTNGSSLLLAVPQGESSTINGQNTDVDHQDVKYSKRLKKKKRQNTNRSVPRILALLAIFSSVLAVWHGAKHMYRARRDEGWLVRRHRAAQFYNLLHAKDLPHEAGGEEDSASQTRRLEQEFALARMTRNNEDLTTVLKAWLGRLNIDICNNVKGGIRWLRPYLLPTLAGEGDDDSKPYKAVGQKEFVRLKEFFKVRRGTMRWEAAWEELLKSSSVRGPQVDYTTKTKYIYPPIELQVPPAAQYPQFKSLQQLMVDWHQDEDYPGVIKETLLHFNFSDPVQLEAAKRFRNAEVPFKLYDVPELDSASQKWTDEYVSSQFDSKPQRLFSRDTHPIASGVAQESANNYFAFFTAQDWVVTSLGLPPVRNNDWSFEKWSNHSKYADSVRLSFDQPHFYWQAGVDREERKKPQSEWSFISRDLPSFSSPTETFFVFNPEEQKGIQCRFGERGVVAATHYDGGRNCVGMITGAKRYVLSPPRECSKLGIFTSRKSPIYRHSLLNFAHIRYLDDLDNGMSKEERRWLVRARSADSVETVLKSGEVLYIPSHWFHYIISLQKSAQCNVRSGIDKDGNPAFGNRATVEQCRP